MDLKTLLDAIPDQRSEAPRCTFNGYLEDYTNQISDDHVLYERFKEIIQYDPTVKIIVDFNYTMNKKNVANQIIRYKDAFKIPTRYWQCPYLLYGATENRGSFAIMLGGESELDYLFMKGVYYSLTEIDALLYEYRNKILTSSSHAAFFNIDYFENVVTHKSSIGSLQKQLDRQLFEDNASLIERALTLSDQVRSDVEASYALENQDDAIYMAIVRWFLLKKALYVQTMIDQVLRQALDNDIKKVRTLAKQHVDRVQFIPLAIMWRSKKRI
ncbi:MAG: hypothetical protein GX845_00425 [Erysipelothrix sp.]|nr:hypothetical protein [Erysipelothrix sp.]